MNIVNLTPHPITILNDEGETIAYYPPSGTVARATQTSEKIGELDGVDVVSTKFGAPVDLPAAQQGKFYLVSAITASAAQAHGRFVGDLLLTIDPVRDDQGRIIGCRRLATLDPKAFARDPRAKA